MIKPGNEAELAEAVAGATGPLRVIGGGTRDIGRPVAGEVLSVAGLTGVTLYEPGALTLVARAGTPLAEVEAVLAAEGQRLAFEPMDHRGVLGTKGAPTIGGVVAANISGPRRVQAGAARDAVIGVRFVDGQGAAIKNGGRVMKNVTGYDLVKLLAGSWGTLGVLSEVSFKVLPRPDAEATLIVDMDDAGRAQAALAAALGSPFDVTGAAFVPGQGALIRVEGFTDSVKYRVGRLSDVLATFGPVDVQTDAGSAAIWTAVRDVSAFQGRAGDVWRFSVKPSDGPGVAARLGAEAVMFDWGGGLIWALMPEGVDARARAGGFGGHATLVKASAATRAAIAPFQPEAGPLAAISAGLRARFDPRGILNPGIMV